MASPHRLKGYRGPLVAFGAVACFGYAIALPAREEPSPQLDYIHDVGPIFKAHCLSCHSGAKPADNLDLSSVAAMRKAKELTPGKANPILERLTAHGDDRMPMNAAPLRPQDIKLIQSWIEQGAVELGKGRSATHWAYVPPVAPQVPKLANANWVRNPIDAFVLRRVRAERLKPSPEADKVTLIRRLSLDLIGLPPTLEEVQQFLADKSPDAYEKTVNRLLASSHFGERMALPWLDAARYADSNGFQMDGDNFQYLWRDWVVKSINANMPFDVFTIDQLAGDLLPNPTLDQEVATAFNRNHMLNGEGGAIEEEQRSVTLFDRVDTTSTTWLGITMACARCHDHKYDPFTQKDYYSLLAYFNNVPESGLVGTNGQYGIADPWIYAGTPEQMAERTKWRKDADTANGAFAPFDKDQAAQTRWEATVDRKSLPKEIAPILDMPAEKRSIDDRGKLHVYYLDHGLTGEAKAIREESIAANKKLDELQNVLPRVMVMSDAKPRPAHIFSRGNYMAPADLVTPATQVVLTHPGATAKTRLDLARWIVSPTNPLTARVQVNRYWQLLFGTGLVKTPENFGIQSEDPVYQDLLDWLAVDFEHGWDVKKLVKTIVMSSTYRQSSKRTPELALRDPENRLLARGARFRLPAMLLRDEALAASGLLNPAIGGKPVYPYQPKGIWDSLDITDERDFKYPQSLGSDLYRRSIYTFWRRTISPGDIFDAATRQTCTVRVSTTSTPLHALTTLNDVAWNEAARALAENVIHSSPSVDGRLNEAFQRVCARKPSEFELGVLERSLNRAATSFRADPKAADAFLAQGDSPRDKKIDPVWHAAYASVCLAIFNLDEALTRE